MKHGYADLIRNAVRPMGNDFQATHAIMNRGLWEGHLFRDEEASGVSDANFCAVDVDADENALLSVLLHRANTSINVAQNHQEDNRAYNNKQQLPTTTTGHSGRRNMSVRAE